jgi:energy-coupling factor transport system substrate-specific component
MNHLMETGKKNMIYGALWFFGGSIVTIWGYSAASHSSGTYYVFYGAVIAGLVQFFSGLGQYRKGKKAGPDVPPVNPVSGENAVVPPAFNSTPPAFNSAPPTRKLWQFGKREILFTLLGLAIYAGVAIIWKLLDISTLNTPLGYLSFFPATVVPVFFGLVFGPIAGLLTGLLGAMLVNLSLGYGIALLGSFSVAIIGFIPGLISAKLTTYKSLNNILWSELIAIAGFLVSDLLLVIVLSVQNSFNFISIYASFTLSDAISILILLPMLLFIYGTVVQNAKELA